MLSHHRPACLLKRRLSRPSIGFCVATRKGKGSEVALEGANRAQGGAGGVTAHRGAVQGYSIMGIDLLAAAPLANP